MTDDVTLYLGDMLEIIPTLEAQSVDAILTDIPYGTTACSWDVVIPFDDLWRAVKHVLKPRGVFVTTASQPFTSALVMSNPGWFRYEWVWDKVNRYTGYLDANRKPLKRHENICVFSKNGHIYNPQMEIGIPYKANRSGKPPSIYRHDLKIVDGINNGTRYPYSILPIVADTKAEALHPTQKPVTLYEYLIRTYTNPGDLVGDFCMGSGTTGVAAVNTGRRFVGCELREDYYQIAQRRIAEAQQQIRMAI